ncbi:hypothetical protein [Nocardia lijiangensis]|uniref:hypothetical protein n=1 Tax=Nocardia lijiangensis TaxID=299618 RepID=UPI0012DCE035|nr:hypothetical protein [Nocardia lijiangensis]
MTEGRVMAALLDSGPLALADIARVACKPKPTIEPAVRALACRGLIEKTGEAWALSERGRAFAATPRGRNALDVPLRRP